MEQTLAALGGILLRAIPTFLLVLFLYFYLKRFIFRPLDAVLAGRSEVTDGARKQAAAAMAEASQKTAQCESAISAARAEISKVQEQQRKSLRDEHAAKERAARERAHAAVGEARRQLQEETASLKRSLAAETEALSAQIAQAILGGTRN
jgi:F-type H+-transporting ATPase subunit b